MKRRTSMGLLAYSALGVAAVGIRPRVAQAATNINFSLNWLLGPQHAEFVVAESERLFYPVWT